MKLTLSQRILLLVIVQVFNIAMISCSGSIPRIEQHPMSVIVNVSDPVTLECRASGEPKPKITWYRDGHLLNIVTNKNEASILSNNKYTLIHDSNLYITSSKFIITNASLKDNGEYVCLARNEAGFTKSQSALLNLLGKSISFFFFSE